MSRNYDADGRCRHCGRLDGEHKAHCHLAPEPPDRDRYPLVDPEAVDRAEDRYVDTMTGEDRA